MDGDDSSSSSCSRTTAKKRVLRTSVVGRWNDRSGGGNTTRCTVRVKAKQTAGTRRCGAAWWDGPTQRESESFRATRNGTDSVGVETSRLEFGRKEIARIEGPCSQRVLFVFKQTF